MLIKWKKYYSAQKKVFIHTQYIVTSNLPLISFHSSTLLMEVWSVSGLLKLNCCLFIPEALCSLIYYGPEVHKTHKDEMTKRKRMQIYMRQTQNRKSKHGKGKCKGNKGYIAALKGIAVDSKYISDHPFNSKEKLCLWVVFHIT